MADRIAARSSRPVGETAYAAAPRPTSSSAGSRRGSGCGSTRCGDDYGVGIGTLREILSRLSAEGLVLAEGQRGFEVPPVTAAELRELAELRLLLETPCAGAVLRRRRRGVGGPGRRRPPQARGDRAAHDRRPARRGAGLEALRRRVPPGADLGLRLAGADGGARQRLRPLPALPDGRRLLPRRGRRRRAPALRDCALARDAAAAAATLRRHIRGCIDFIVARERLPG